MEAKRRILVIDDTPSNIKILNDALKQEYNISVATNGEDGLAVAKGPQPPDLILLDIMMPGMDGYEVCRRLQAAPETSQIPILFVTAMSEVADETKGLSLGALDYITKPISIPIVKARVRNHMRLKLHQDYLEELVRERTRELDLTRDATIYSMAGLAETRDNETGGHIRRTQYYVKALAEHLQDHPEFSPFLNPNNIELMHKSAPLHDIGKVGVPDSILLKPGRLTPEEFEEMKRHTIYGRDAILKAEEKLSTSSFLRFAKEIAYTHHEKWDGSGYPEGVKGRDIPISGRIMALADVYDALISRRVYKPPLPHSKSVEIIMAGRGKHFDPAIADAFAVLGETFRHIALEFADFEEERQTLAS